MTLRKAPTVLAIAVLAIAAEAAAGVPTANEPSLFFDGCDAVLDSLCSLSAVAYGATPFSAPPPLPAPMLKAGVLPEFFLRIDGFYYPLDMSQPAALFLLGGTVSARKTSARNCRRSDGQAQVIDATWYAFVGEGFEIIYEVSSLQYRLGRTPSSRHIMDLRTTHGLLVCDGQVAPGADPDDMIFRDGMEPTAP